VFEDIRLAFPFSLFDFEGISEDVFEKSEQTQIKIIIDKRCLSSKLSEN
jgi:hypothetical protein